MTNAFTGPKSAFDTETTGVDPWEDRIVSAALVLTDADPDTGEYVKRTVTFLLNPGIEIPAGATAIHGITDQMVEQSGADPAVALASILGFLDARAEAGIPLVVYNAPFDLTMLNAEAERHGLKPLADDFGPVIDPLIIDKHIDKYRAGSRRLVDVCRMYGVELGDAHNAAADAVAALSLAEKFALVGDADKIPDAEQLHLLQVLWQEEQRTSYNRYRTSRGEFDKMQGPGWPFYQKDWKP